jgi:hypothetical protein
VLKRQRLLALGLLEARDQQVAVVRDGVVAVLVQRTQQLLQALLHAVRLQGARRRAVNIGKQIGGQEKGKKLFNLKPTCFHTSAKQSGMISGFVIANMWTILNT